MAVAVVGAVLVVVVLVVLVEADGLAVLRLDGGAREEADWEELVWRLDGISDQLGKKKPIALVGLKFTG